MKQEVNTFWMSDDDVIPDLFLRMLKSYTLHGYKVKIFQFRENVVNEDIINDMFEFADASDVVDINVIDELRRYPHYNGNEVYRPLSDYFRYSLLYQRGGWWVDMDTVMLKSFDFNQPHIMTTYGRAYHVNGVLKEVPGTVDNCFLYVNRMSQKLYREVCEDFWREMPKGNIMLDSVKILRRHVFDKGLDMYIVPMKYMNPFLIGHMEVMMNRWFRQAYTIHLSNYSGVKGWLGKGTFIDKIMELVDKDEAPTYDRLFG